MELFNAIEKALGPVPLIAEDLGVQTDEVKKLLEESGFPGMRVLIFGFTPDYDNEHLPHNYKPNSIVYTSTHDSQTVCEADHGHLLRAGKAVCIPLSAYLARRGHGLECHQVRMGVLGEHRYDDPAGSALARCGFPHEYACHHRRQNWRWRVRAEALNPTVSSMLGEMPRRICAGKKMCYNDTASRNSVVRYSIFTDKKGRICMKMTTAIFDLDGTLLNSLGDLCDSVTYAVESTAFRR